MRWRLPRLSSRFHIALGLSGLVAALLLLASWVGLVPDRDGAVRDGRRALAEAVAISATALLAEDDDPRLSQVLGFIQERNPDLQAVLLRRADGQLHASHGEVPAAGDAQGSPRLLSSDARVLVPLLRDGAAWGSVELVFAPGQTRAGLASVAPGSPMFLAGAMGLVCFTLFYLQLRRLLRHLDPSRVIPARVRNAFDTLAEGLLVLDPRGRIVLANRAFTDVVGGDLDQLMGRDVATLDWSFPAAAPGQPATDWPRLVASGQAQRNQLMYLPDTAGRRRSFMVNTSPVTGAGQQSAGLLVSLDDVTALEEQELELRMARDAAEAANRAKSEFLASMSHEIRTPMNAILGFAELLRRGWQSDSREAQRHLDTILGSGRHLLALINDILDLSKVEAGRMEVERLPTAVHEVVKDVVAILRVRAEEKGIELVADFPQALPASVATDPSRVRQIVTNLVGNALKFTERGRVVVRVSMQLDTTPALLAIDVCDSGIGIPADRLDAIFDPFVQADSSTARQFGGTGLGLAISRRFARALGGDITVSSTPGQGSTFHVTLDPGELDDVAWIAPESLAAVHRRDAETVATRWQFEPRRVLVVDDGPENREFVRLVLETSGLQVLEAENGAVALEAVARERPDLVLMDVQMPVMDGYEATRRLRERGDTLPVLALTANAMKGFEREIEAAGFTGYLTKPVDIDTLLSALALRLGGRPVEAAEAADAPAPAALQPATPPAARPPVETPAPRPRDGSPVVSRLAGHPRLARVVRSFGRTLPVKLQAMHEALEGRRLQELAELAHWLKGAGGTVGFDAFFEPARELEVQARAGDLPALQQSLLLLQDLADRLVIPDEEGAAAPTA